MSSLLEQLKNKKNNLKSTETLVRYLDGKQVKEKNNEIIVNLNEKSCGFIIDTKPDKIPACIIDKKLYLGSQDAVDMENIINFNITHVISIGIDTPEINLINHKIHKIHFPILDLPETDLNDFFPNIFKLIDEIFLEPNNSILIHCNAGVSRSPTIVIGYLIKKYNLSFNEAFDLVKKKRESIQPNPGFIKQLKLLKN